MLFHFIGLKIFQHFKCCQNEKGENNTKDFFPGLFKDTPTSTRITLFTYGKTFTAKL